MPYRSPALTCHTNDTAVLRDYVERIKLRHGISQRDQAAALGVGWTTYRDWLNGTAKWPKTAQIALESWALAPLENDDDDIAARCPINLLLDDERALVAAWRCIRGDDKIYNLPLPSTVNMWPVEMLKCFARDGHLYPAFQMAVKAELYDLDGNEVPLPKVGAEMVYLAAYEWCAPEVFKRLTELIE
jgi:hypothetical protein